MNLSKVAVLTNCLITSSGDSGSGAATEEAQQLLPDRLLPVVLPLQSIGFSGAGSKHKQKRKNKNVPFTEQPNIPYIHFHQNAMRFADLPTGSVATRREETNYCKYSPQYKVLSINYAAVPVVYCV